MTGRGAPQSFPIPGPPHGKGRPKFRRRGAHVQTYTDEATVAAERRVVAAWEAAGSPRWHDAPISVQLAVFAARPGDHFLGDGSYSKKGRAAVVCMKMPDLDNVAKLVLDALNGRAFDDDKQVVELFCQRFWAPKRDSWTMLTMGVFAPVTSVVGAA